MMTRHRKRRAKSEAGPRAAARDDWTGRAAVGRASRPQVGGAQVPWQVPIDRYVVDFASVGARLVVEVDGESRTDRADVGSDPRPRVISAAGWTLVRVTNDDVLHNLEGVLMRIVGGAGLDAAAWREQGPAISSRGDVLTCFPSPREVLGRRATLVRGEAVGAEGGLWWVQYACPSSPPLERAWKLLFFTWRMVRPSRSVIEFGEGRFGGHEAEVAFDAVADGDAALVAGPSAPTTSM